MKKGAAPIPFAGSELGDVRHVGAFFISAEEDYRGLLPFIKDGFAPGDKAVHMVNPDQHQAHLQRLTVEMVQVVGSQEGIAAPNAPDAGRIMRSL